MLSHDELEGYVPLDAEEALQVGLQVLHDVAQQVGRRCAFRDLHVRDAQDDMLSVEQFSVAISGHARAGWREGDGKAVVVHSLFVPLQKMPISIKIDDYANSEIFYDNIIIVLFCQYISMLTIGVDDESHWSIL